MRRTGRVLSTPAGPIHNPLLRSKVMSTDHSTVRYALVIGCVAYRVGTDGSVWTRWKRVAKTAGRGSEVILGDVWKELSGHPRNTDGYCVVNLRGLGNCFVHRLVLEAFVSPCPEGMEACHYPDRNRSNNMVDNLRWATHEDNYADSVLHGTVARGEKQGGALLTDQKVREMRRKYATGETSYHLLGKEYGVHWSTVQLVIKRKTWKHVV